MIFKEYLRLLNNHLKRDQDRKILLILDNLSAHYNDYDKFKLWRNDLNRTTCIYLDEEAYSNIKLAFLPPRCTSFLQSSDMGYYSFIQQKFRQWLNSELLNNREPSKLDAVTKAYSIMKTVPASYIRSCWSRTQCQVNFKLLSYNLSFSPS